MYTSTANYTYDATDKSLTKHNHFGQGLQSNTFVNDGPYIGYRFRPMFNGDDRSSHPAQCSMALINDNGQVRQIVGCASTGQVTYMARNPTVSKNYIGTHSVGDLIEVIFQSSNVTISVNGVPIHTEPATLDNCLLQSYIQPEGVIQDLEWISAASFDSTAISNTGLKTSMDTAAALQDDTQRRLAYQTALTDATVAKFTGGRVGVKTTVLSVLASIDAGDTLVLSRFLGVTNRQTVVVRPEETGTPVVVAVDKAVYIPGVGRWTRENDRVRTLTHDSAADTYSLQINAETPLAFEDQAAGTTVTYVDDGKEWNLTLGSGHETRIGGGFFRVSSATHGLTIVNDAFVRVK